MASQRQSNLEPPCPNRAHFLAVFLGLRTRRPCKSKFRVWTFWQAKTCHFGGAWSAYWWSRAAGTFIRIGHKLLRVRHFLAVYVDDNFALLPRSTAPLCESLLLCLALALGLPLSWRKLRSGTSLRWIGWEIFLESCPAATLPLDKRKRLPEMLAPLCVPLADRLSSSAKS